ncbi:MAG: hypothetical protein Q9219_004725 [cf. Caloplaca sp. 3 TL-2023]
MASLIIASGALAYDRVQKSRAKRSAAKAHNLARFSELERENAARMQDLRAKKMCFCQKRSDWRAGEGGCPVHDPDEGEAGRGGGGEKKVRGTDTVGTTGETEGKVADGGCFEGGGGLEKGERERELVVPDVRGVRARYRDEIEGEGVGGKKNRGWRERVLRRKRGMGKVGGEEGAVIR